MRGGVGSALLAAAIVLLSALPAQAEPPPAAEMADLINQDRRERGRPALALYWDLMDDADAQANRMAARGEIFHHPHLTVVTDDWDRLGENVGSGSSVRAVHRAFMRSDHHRDNLLGDYTAMGIGVATASGRRYVAVIFMKGSAGLPNGPFRDTIHSVHHEDAVQMWREGVTTGCGVITYCPEEPLTRGEMAAFLTRALHLPPGPDAFTDDQGHLFEAEINALAAAGITGGCSRQEFCPDGYVTRGQMAAFLRRAAGLPGGRDAFSDDDGHLFEKDINAIARAGITTGCGPGLYCPDDRVTRGEMASFLVRMP